MSRIRAPRLSTAARTKRMLLQRTARERQLLPSLLFLHVIQRATRAGRRTRRARATPRWAPGSSCAPLGVSRSIALSSAQLPPRRTIPARARDALRTPRRGPGRRVRAPRRGRRFFRPAARGYRARRRASGCRPDRRAQRPARPTGERASPAEARRTEQAVGPRRASERLAPCFERRRPRGRRGRCLRILRGHGSDNGSRGDCRLALPGAGTAAREGPPPDEPARPASRLSRSPRRWRMSSSGSKGGRIARRTSSISSAERCCGA